NGSEFQDILVAGGSFVAGGYAPGGWVRSNGYPAYSSVVVNLPYTAARTTVVLRWHMISAPDPNFGGGGFWWIDTIHLCDGYACDVIPQPELLAVDTAGNQVWEPGETVDIDPYYYNNGGAALDLSGTATSLTGPPGAAYTIADSVATYGSIYPGFLGGCSFAPDCYSVSVDNPATRPAAHWDAFLQEALSNGTAMTWVLHIGGSFADAPTSNPFYPFIENIFHHGITSGCGGGNYCPDSSVTRGQMAVFLLKAKHGSAFVPPACTGVFPDVPCPSQFADWIEELFHQGITGGCGGGNYCPNNPVRRDQMAAFLLKAEHGSSYTPPACTGIFPDVACPSIFADWIEQFFHENITGGCGGGNYCPLNPNTRGQMAVFLVKSFGLQLYGP
ncbi:MAG: S-layer homology domain-containing protein, partial [Thermoanaerobaculia bacterium]